MKPHPTSPERASDPRKLARAIKTMKAGAGSPDMHPNYDEPLVLVIDAAEAHLKRLLMATYGIKAKART